jgi:pyridoxamine 5'-phosphate oxidase
VNLIETADPIRLFERWYAEAVATGMKLPEAMALATATRGGAPSARMVLLRGVSRRGFVFFTNYESRKGRELARNPRAALLFYWAALDRQVRIEGALRQVTRRESIAYFRTRPRESQLAAWASAQSRVIAGRGALENSYARMEARFRNKMVPCPPFWGGYRLAPTTIEFWQSREHRLHDRTRYTKARKGWKAEVLGP